MIRPLFLALIFAVSACAPQAATEDFTQPTSSDAVLFSDVLAEYQDLNTRLENVAAPILKANAGLCPKTSRDIGITVHTVSDYPIELQGVARSLIGVTDELSVRTVRAGSNASKVGLKPGDQIKRMGAYHFEDRARTQYFYKAISNKALQETQVDIEVLRGSEIINFNVTPESICGYPVIVFFNENMNGHTDGKEILITSELLRRVTDDVNLALIISHELAHAVGGHVGKTPTKALELEADRMGLVLMARAGLDITQAIAYWKDAPHPSVEASGVHPSTQERYENFLRAKARIEAKQNMGLPLTLSP